MSSSDSILRNKADCFFKISLHAQHLSSPQKLYLKLQPIGHLKANKHVRRTDVTAPHSTHTLYDSCRMGATFLILCEPKKLILVYLLKHSNYIKTIELRRFRQ